MGTMDKFPKPHAQQLDDQLAYFTDRVLSGENETEMDENFDQAELAELQKTVLRIKAAAQAAQPGEATALRIRSRLLLEWNKGRQVLAQSPQRFIWPSWSLPRMVLAGGLVVLGVFVVVVLFFTPLAAPLVGAAEGSPVWALLFIVVGIVIISLLLWLDHHD